MPGVKAFSTTKMEKSRVCRCLFGKPDHNVIRKDLSDSLKKSQKEAEVKWNFDFEKDVPLEGRYEWDVVLDHSEYIPDFYKKGYFSKCNLQRVPRIGNLTKKIDTTSAIISSKDTVHDDVDSASDLSDLGCELLSDSDDSSQEVCNKDSKSESTNIHRKKRSIVQTQIDEFCKKRKRATVEDSSSSKKKRDL